MSDDARIADARSRLVSWCERHLDRPMFTEPEASGRSMEVDLEENAAFLTNMSLAAVLAERDDLADRVFSWQRSLLGMPRKWRGKYAFGLFAAGLARSYDWLHEAMPADLVAPVRDAVAEYAEHAYSVSFAGTRTAHWWAGAYLHHDFWVPTAGYGETALAIEAEHPSAAAWADRALEEFRTAIAWLGDDGAWPEGPADWAYAVGPLLWFLAAWESARGSASVPDEIDSWLKRTGAYRLAHRLSDGTYLYHGDSFRSGRYNTSGNAVSHILYRLAARYADPALQWLAAAEEQLDVDPKASGALQAGYEGMSAGRVPPVHLGADSIALAWRLLWHDPAVVASEPEAETRIDRFENLDSVVARLASPAHRALLYVTCGPLCGHEAARRITAGEPYSPTSHYHVHSDAGSFSFVVDGVYFIVPPGYARRSSSFQNCLEIDGRRLTFDPSRRPRLLAAEHRDDYSYIAADVTDAYERRDELEVVVRHFLLFSTPRPRLVVYDHVKRRTSSHFAELRWAIHTDPHESVTEHVDAGALLRAARGGTNVTLSVWSRLPFAWSFEQITDEEGHPLLNAVAARFSEWYSTHASIVSCLEAHRGGERRDGAEPLDMTGGQGLVWHEGGDTTVLLFSELAHEAGDRSRLQYRWAGRHRLISVSAAGGISDAMLDDRRD